MLKMLKKVLNVNSLDNTLQMWQIQLMRYPVKISLITYGR